MFKLLRCVVSKIWGLDKYGIWLNWIHDVLWKYVQRRKIRLMQCNMSSSKKLTCKGTCGRCLSVLGPEPHTPPPLTVWYVYTVYLFTQRRGGRGVEPERRLEGQHFTKLGKKYQHDWLYLPSINSDKHLPQSPFTGQFL
jgi:hypothetical protein